MVPWTGPSVVATVSAGGHGVTRAASRESARSFGMISTLVRSNIRAPPNFRAAVEIRSARSSSGVTQGGPVQYMLLIYGCDRPEPGDPGFEEALTRVNAFAAECRRRGAFVYGHPLQAESTATTVSV